MAAARKPAVKPTETLASFKAKVVSGVQEYWDYGCDKDHIRDFCQSIGITPPTQEIRVEFTIYCVDVDEAWKLAEAVVKSDLLGKDAEITDVYER